MTAAPVPAGGAHVPEAAEPPAALRRAPGALLAIASPLLAIALALVAGAVFILAIGERPLEIYALMARESFGTGYGVGQTLFRATPLVFTGSRSRWDSAPDCSTSASKASSTSAGSRPRWRVRRSAPGPRCCCCRRRSPPPRSRVPCGPRSRAC